ncbi:MAG: alkaline phosphatase family protein [Planctomycetota bacterium]|nr:alkaline phosphatase family protein [Planctomycetota bacterium]MDP6941680.1 alkaline phosphatase family protein [Planctomycetota bacterium]
MTKLAIIGIDGATWDIIQPMVDEGELPHIAKIIAEGASGSLESEIPPITPPAWTSMMTGLNPGKHGIFHFIRRELGSYKCPLNESSHFAGMDLASVLGRKGWSSGLFNVPMTFPPIPIEGWVVSGIPCPLNSSSLFSKPTMEAEFAEFLGHPYRADLNYSPWDGDTEPESENLKRYESLRKELFAIEKDRLNLLPILLNRHPVDLFFTVISITDRCQHYFWKFQDPAHAGWSEEGEKLYKEVIRDSYRLADEFVGKVRKEVGPSVPVALVSDHGFGPQNWDFHINCWLEEQDLLFRTPTPRWVFKFEPLRRAKGLLGKVAIPKVRRKRNADFSDVDWSRTRAFCSLHGICLNLRGREPEGIVSQDEAEDLLNEIRHRLQKVRLPDGSPAVDWFVDNNKTYKGHRVAEAPDLQFQMGKLSCLVKDDWNASEIFSERRFAAVSGTHRFNGIFALAAPGVKKRKTIDGMHIRDTAPTLFHSLQLPVPSWMEGKAHEDLLSKHRKAVIEEEDIPINNRAKDGFGTEDSSAVEESLRALGYLQ